MMSGSNLGMQTWALGVYLLATGIRCTASMKLHRAASPPDLRAAALAAVAPDASEHIAAQSVAGQIDESSYHRHGRSKSHLHAEHRRWPLDTVMTTVAPTPSLATR